MRKFILIFISCLIFFAVETNAQIAKFTLTAEQTVRDTIYQWLWKADGNGKFFPFLRARRSQIDFFNAEGKIKAKYNYLPLSKIAISPRKEIVGFAEPVYEQKGELRPAFVKYHICRSNGREIFSHEYRIKSDEPYPEIYVNDAGDVILADGASGSLKIFHHQSNREILIDLFDDDVYNFEKPIDLAISRDGRYFTVVAQKKPFSFDETTQSISSGEPHLFLYSINGEKIWQQQLQSAIVSTVDISPQNNFIVTAHYTPSLQGEAYLKTSIFSFSGNKLLDVPIKFRFCQFSDDEKMLFLADSKKVLMVNLSKKTFEKYPIEVKYEGQLICDLSLLNKKVPLILLGRSVFAGNHFEFRKLKIYSLENRKWKKLAIDLDNEAIIKSSFKMQNGQIGLGFVNGFKIFRETHK